MFWSTLKIVAFALLYYIEVTDVSGKTIASKVFKDQRNVNLDMKGFTGLNLIRIFHHDGSVEVLKHITAE